MTPMTSTPGPMPPEIVYPSSDGKPMAESIEKLRRLGIDPNAE